MISIPLDIITATIPEFCRISGVGRSKLYELLANGTIQSICVGRRRLVIVDSYRRLVEEALDAKRQAA